MTEEEAFEVFSTLDEDHDGEIHKKELLDFAGMLYGEYNMQQEQENWMDGSSPISKVSSEIVVGVEFLHEWRICSLFFWFWENSRSLWCFLLFHIVSLSIEVSASPQKISEINAFVNSFELDSKGFIHMDEFRKSKLQRESLNLIFTAGIRPFLLYSCLPSFVPCFLIVSFLIFVCSSVAIVR